MVKKNENPFLFSDTGKRYHTFDYAMKRRYGTKVVKIPLDGGFTCPNLDGTCGTQGCFYCEKKGLALRGKTISEQFSAGVRAVGDKWAKSISEKPRFIPYFQTFSSTYASVSVLESLYREALAQENVVGLTIATRADCITPEIVFLLRQIATETHLTVELGLQTIHDKTASSIGRGHDFEAFQKGFAMLAGIERCVHLIDGLPGETSEMMIESAKIVGELGAEQIKFHSLFVAKGTKLATDYEQGRVSVLTLDEFVDILIAQLQVIPPEVIVARVNGDAEKESLIAPAWCRNKFAVLNKIDAKLREIDSFQGQLYILHKNKP